MKIRLLVMLAVLFFAQSVLGHAQELTADDLSEKIKSIVDFDFEQEDQLKPILGDYADSINKINVLIQKNVDKEVIVGKLIKINNALDQQLNKIFTPDQMHSWNAEKNDFYKEILVNPDNQAQ